MISRRHALKLAAAMPGVVPVLTMSPANAAALLDAPIDANVPDKTERETVLDPVEFAEHLNGLDFGRDDLDMASERAVEVYRLQHELEQAVPALTEDPAVARLWGELSDATTDYACESGWSGVRAGAAYENLRLALLSPKRICPDCFGVYGAGPTGRRDRATCRTCQGTGVVATPGVVAR